MRARFWIYHVPTSGEGGCVRLSLEDGQEVDITTAGRHEEGYWMQCDTYSRDGDTVRSEHNSDQTDCDGRFATYRYHACRIDQLETYVNENTGQRLPDWQEESSGQRDYFAEVAGY